MVKPMVKREKIDMGNLTFVPVSKVPESVVQAPWSQVFEKIPAGQALVLTEAQANPDAVRTALKRLQKKRKQFLNLAVRVRVAEGKRLTYVLNTGRGTTERTGRADQ
jgi:hypothetical protein